MTETPPAEPDGEYESIVEYLDQFAEQRKERVYQGVTKDMLQYFAAVGSFNRSVSFGDLPEQGTLMDFMATWDNLRAVVSIATDLDGAGEVTGYSVNIVGFHSVSGDTSEELYAALEECVGDAAEELSVEGDEEIICKLF